MSDDLFYMPGEPEYNPNDPNKPRTTSEPIANVDGVSSNHLKDLGRVAGEMPGTVAGIRNRMQMLSSGLMSDHANRGRENLKRLLGDDNVPITDFRREEIFPESDLQVKYDTNKEFPELKVQNYMVDVHLPGEDVVADYIAVDAEVSLAALKFDKTLQDQYLSLPSDNVNHPKHYNQYEGFEVIDVAKQLRSPDGDAGSNYFRGNVFKYLARAGWKVPDTSRKEQIEKEIEDLEKAKFYLQAEIDRLYQKAEDAE